MDLTFLSISRLQILSLVFMLITAWDYFRKKKIWTLENYLYTLLLIAEIAGLFANMFTAMTSVIYPNENAMVWLNRIYMICVVTVGVILTFYIYVVTSKRNQGYIRLEENKDASYWGKMTTYTVVISLINVFIILFLPVTFYENNLLYGTGPAIYFGFVVYGIMLILMIYFLFSARKRVNKKVMAPFILFIVLTVVGALIQLIYPDVLIIDLVTSFSIVFLNFTIENPDLNLIENLNIAKQSAEKANRAKTDFLSSMSHEIRTPLNAIVGFSRALAEEKISDEAMEEVNNIIESSNSLLSVINNILDISKMDAGGIVITNIDYSTKQLIKSLITYAEELAGKKNINFEKNIDPDLPSVLFGDTVRIKQIVNNLLSNAFRYTDEGTITLTIKAITLKKKCKLFIIVEDTGVGIDEEDVSKIYNQFDKLNGEATNNYSVGTGLGLTISKRLVEMMDGSIDFESIVGKGSKFLVTFDQVVSDKKIDSVDDYVDGELSPFDCSSKKILIIDDNVVNLKVAKKLFKDYNVEPELEKSVTESIKKIEGGEKYDIIFMDDMMPSMTGSEAIVVLRKIPGYNIPTVILTANQTPGIKQKYMDIGFDDYLAKPIVKDELCFILNKYFNSEVDKDKK